MFPVRKTFCIPFDTNDVSSDGESLDRVEMADGSLRDLKRSESPKGTGNVFEFGTTCVRSTASGEGTSIKPRSKKSFGDKAWMPCQMEAFERTIVVDGERRVEAFQLKDCTKSPNGASAYPASKVFASYKAHITTLYSTALVPARNQANPKKICEVEVKRHGLVKIFQEEGRFKGRITEKTGPFSRTSTVPLHCEGLRDPEEAMKSLMHLPQSALCRHIHILSDRARGVEKFIFVGKLGLRGGGNGEASSSSDVHGHQTAAEGSASRYVARRALTRTESSMIRRTLVEKQYSSLEEVVKAHNEAIDAQERNGLTRVMRKVLSVFHGMHVREVTDNRGEVVREYLALCKLDGRGDNHLLFLKDVFDSLRDKMYNDALHSRYLIEAVEHALQNVDNEIFEDDPNCLLQLAQFLLKAFDPRETSFSREMFPVQCSALHVVHQCLKILFDIGSGGWDPNRPDGLYAKFKNWSQSVIDAAEHYPAKYQAMLVQQSLSFLQSSKRGVRIANNARRIANLVYGTVGVCQAARNAVFLDFDLGNAESTANALSRARESRIVREEQWYKCLHALDTVRFAAIEDPSAFGQFNELLSSLVLEEEGSNHEQCKVMRFGVVEMLTSLAIHGKEDVLRCTSAETLSRLAEQTDEWDWSSDPDLFLEMLDNLAELSSRGCEPEKHIAHEAVEKLASNVHNRVCKRVLSEWLAGKTVKERIKSVTSVRTDTIGNELFTRVWKSLEGELLRAPAEVYRSPSNRHHDLFSDIVVDYFVGRNDEFAKLVETFRSSTKEVVVSATIVGPGGIGKSQLAAKVFLHLKSTSNYVNDFWISSDSTEILQAKFLQIAEYLELQMHPDIPKMIRRVREELRKSRSLFVFDGAADFESIRDYFPLANGHVIVTTRDSGARDWGDVTVRLNPFDKLDARDLAGEFGFGDQSHAKDLEELFDILPRFPLALTQFFSMLEKDELSSPAEWLAKVRHYDVSRREVEVMKELAAKEDSGVRGMVFVFNSSVQRIKEKNGDLGSRSLDLLAKLALLDPNGVPIEWVYKWFGSEDEQSRKTTRKSVRLLERFSHVSWDRKKNHISIHEETQHLARHLLLGIGESALDTKEASKEQTNKDVFIDAKIERRARYFLYGVRECAFDTKEASKEQMNKNVTDHIRVIVHSVTKYNSNWRTDHSNRDLWTILAQNLLALLKHCKNCMDFNVKRIVLGQVSTAYTRMCMFNESLSYSQKALAVCERFYGDADHQHLVYCITSYSVELERTGRENEALPLLKRALEMCERIYGDVDHPDLVKSIEAYSVGLSRVRRDNEALPLLKRAFDMCERLHGDADHPDLVECIMRYAIGLSRAGRDNEALPLLKKALKMCERLHKDADHPDLVACITTCARGLSDAGEDNEALPLLKRAFDMCERIYGDVDHPDLVGCITNYAIGLSEAGIDMEALPLRKRALEMSERLYGNADHVELVACLRNYSVGLSRASRHNEALPLFKKALEMCERLHGDVDHPDLVECITNYSVGLSEAGIDMEALPLRKRALDMSERIYGDVDHPNLVQRITNYAVGLSEAERDREALSLLKKALEMCERLHSDDDHPDLVHCITSYAIGLSRAGRDNEALRLRKKALEMCERLHNDADHPDLVKCIRNYAVGISTAGRDNEALPLLKRAFEMCERIHGDVDHPDLVECITSYAVGLSKVGRNNDALPFDKKAFEMCERLFSNADHPDLVNCITTYARGLSEAGRDREALPLFKKALEMCERLRGDADRSDVVGYIRNYAVVLSNTGRENEALPLFKRAFEMCERIHGDADHPDLVKCIEDYFIGLSIAGRDDEALPHRKRALDMCERLYGNADHLVFVRCIMSYAVGLSKVGRNNDALPFDKKAFEMCERLYSNADHPDLVKCIRHYAVSLSEAGRDNKVLLFRKKAFEICERIHGDTDHLDLLECIKEYAITLSRAGIYNEALPLFKRAFEMCERLYGDVDHPDLVECIRNYAITLSRAGIHNEALSLFKRALDMCERLHGNADHPDLVVCIEGYSTGLKRSGRVIRALSNWRKARVMRRRLNNR